MFDILIQIFNLTYKLILALSKILVRIVYKVIYPSGKLYFIWSSEKYWTLLAQFVAGFIMGFIIIFIFLPLSPLIIPILIFYGLYKIWLVIYGLLHKYIYNLPNLISLLFILRIWGKWRLRAYLSYKDEPWHIKLQSRRRNKILLFFFIWCFIYSYGSYELAFLFNINYLFFFTIGYAKLDIPRKNNTVVKNNARGDMARKAAEEFRKEAEELERLLEQEEDSRPKKHGYYVFWRLAEVPGIPLIFKINAFRLFTQDFIVYLIMFLLYSYALHHVIFEEYLFWLVIVEDNDLSAWMLILIITFLINEYFTIKGFFTIKRAVLTEAEIANWREEDEAADEEPITEDEIDPIYDAMREADIRDLDRFAYYKPKNARKGQHAWTAFFYGHELEKNPESPFAKWDGPFLIDYKDWGWEYYKFLLTGRFCEDCAKTHWLLAYLEQLPFWKGFGNTLEQRWSTDWTRRANLPPNDQTWIQLNKLEKELNLDIYWNQKIYPEDIATKKASEAALYENMPDKIWRDDRPFNVRKIKYD